MTRPDCARTSPTEASGHRPTHGPHRAPFISLRMLRRPDRSVLPSGGAALVAAVEKSLMPPPTGRPSSAPRQAWHARPWHARLRASSPSSRHAGGIGRAVSVRTARRRRSRPARETARNPPWPTATRLVGLIGVAVALLRRSSDGRDMQGLSARAGEAQPTSGPVVPAVPGTPPLAPQVGRAASSRFALVRVRRRAVRGSRAVSLNCILWRRGFVRWRLCLCSLIGTFS
jgi:hypothetical protein